MLRDRFLLGIILGIGTLILLALILFFLRQGQAAYVDDSTPEGALRNYLLALQQRDYERAYQYLAEKPLKPSYTQFREPFLQYQGQEITNTVVEIGEVLSEQPDQTAIVQVTLLRGGRDPFGDVYRDQQTARLVRQNGAWKISSAPFPYWGSEWFVPTTKPLPAP